MANDPAGSTWKKWDLHVHTPESIVHNYQGSSEDAWEAFLADLEALPPEFKVIGINDYIFVDGYERVRKAKLKDNRLKNIDLILPVIELRLDKFAGVVKKEKDGSYSQSGWNRINLHVIFDALEPEVIRQQFIGSLAPSYDLIPDASDWRGRWKSVITRESLTELGTMIIESAPNCPLLCRSASLNLSFAHHSDEPGPTLRARKLAQTTHPGDRGMRALASPLSLNDSH